MMNWKNALGKIVDQVRRAAGAAPKNKGGRPRKYATVEEVRAANAKRQADYRERRSQAAEQAAQAERDRNARRYVVDRNGEPLKYRNGAFVRREPELATVPPAPIVVASPPPQPSMVTVAVQPAAIPVASEPVPEPAHSADSLSAWWMDHGVLDFKPDDAQVFLVHQPEIVEYAGQRGQFAIAIPRWHSAYDTLFASVPSIWVAITSSDGAWLKSLLTASPEIRAKMRLFVGDLQTLFTLKRDTDLAIAYRQNVRVDGFYESHFKPIPQDAEQIEALLQPPKPQPTRTVWELDWRIGGSAGSSGHSGARIEVPSSGSNPNGSGHGNDGSGMCF